MGNVEGNGCGPFELLSWHLPVDTKVHHKLLSIVGVPAEI